jgi:uncharacterized membrane protein YjfL (UPF0719 family)
VEAGRKNLARAIFQVGNMLGIFLIAASVVHGALDEDMKDDADLAALADHWKQDLLAVGMFAATSLVLFVAMTRLGCAVLLKARLTQELARGNVAAGIAAGAHSVATGIVIARAIGGRDAETLGHSLVFFFLAQVSLHLLVVLFRWLTSYDDSEEIIGENVAAALSYAGLTIAIALIVGRAVEGDFEGWEASLKGYGIALALGLLLWPVRQLVVEGLLLGARPSFRGGKLDAAIARDRNIGMGALEGGCYLAAALAISRIG